MITILFGTGYPVISGGPVTVARTVDQDFVPSMYLEK